MPSDALILLVDDEPLALRRLEIICRQISGCEVVGTADNGQAAISLIADLKPDIVLLDVHMPVLDGFGLLRELPDNSPPQIIFVTAYDHYGPRAFEESAVDYLLKPVEIGRLEQAIGRARARKEAASAADRLEEMELLVAKLRRAAARSHSAPRWEREIWIKDRTRAYRVNADTVEWVEAARDYVVLHTGDRNHIMRETMAGMEERLGPGPFIRTHRSAIVNMDHVREVVRKPSGAMTLRMMSGAKVPVGRRQASGIYEKLTDFHLNGPDDS